MEHLEECLKEAEADGARIKLIATDGVFSMDGIIADLKSICDLADKYDALVMVDDCTPQALLAEGRGTPEFCDVLGRIDIMTSTLGKAMGGASGGFTLANKDTVAWLRQKSRPYLFSNTLSPAIVATSLKVLEMIQRDSFLIDRVNANTEYFRKEIVALGLTLLKEPSHCSRDGL